MSPERKTPTRREPPPFRKVEVSHVEELSPRLRRVTLTGAELDGLTIDEPAASVRLLLPSPGHDALTMPEWNGNEFLLPNGERPVIRTFTPRRFDPDVPELELWIVVHGEGTASQWAESAQPGDPAAVSGPGRGHEIDPAASAFVLLGDETAIAAISQLLEQLPEDTPVEVHIEIEHADARIDLPSHPTARIDWHELPDGAPPGTTLAETAENIDVGPGTQVWAAGEAAGVQRIRKDLKARDVPRSQTTIRGYWKHGREGT